MSSRKQALSERIRKLNAGYQGMDDQTSIVRDVEALEKQLQSDRKSYFESGFNSGMLAAKQLIEAAILPKHDLALRDLVLMDGGVGPEHPPLTPNSNILYWKTCIK